MELVVNHLTVERGGRLVLAAPDFRVASGQAAVLTGPNGAGKSTLLRALAGLQPIASGEALLDGAALSRDVEAFRMRAAYAGHLDAIKPALTVRGNLAAWAAIFGGGDVEDALSRFGLDHIGDAPTGYCSQGQKRRLGLARLLVSNRPLWLLDEPTVSLDADAAATFANVVRDHCARGGIAVAATHIDIGLPEGPRIALSPPASRLAAAGDPFLTGEWA